ncbi:hypothetical protein H8699_10745 [Christensenellaceae bacterium NSJ-44]|uniref:SHS2 domain-containing protein n=1 Tax=Luoshenia tenuis TaxID=2763654 RepID=A0A926D1T0_9FIRM|nr:cell division FtsA domain-containing protein [Luoshenia tenuis]MBC8529906.1 hypothetical protein [Luoshenia tenuis]
MRKEGEAGVDHGAAVLDFGSSKVICAYGTGAPGRAVQIRGANAVYYRDFAIGRDSASPQSWQVAAAQAVERTQARAGVSFDRAYLVLPGPYSRVTCLNASASVTGERVTPRDMRTVLDQAASLYQPDRYAVAHRTPMYYTLDSGEKLLDPAGAVSGHLRVRAALTLADRFFVQRVGAVMDALGLETAGFVPSALGQALKLIPAQVRDGLCILLDAGYHESCVSLVYADSVIFSSTIPVGGWHMATDLALQLNISLAQAERIKRRFAFGLDPEAPDSAILVQVAGGRVSRFDYGAVCAIIEARAMEIVQEAMRAVALSGYTVGADKPLVVTGGAIAPLRGAKAWCADVTGRKVSMPIPVGAVLNTPMDTAAVGGLHLALQQTEDPEKEERSSLFHKLIRKRF